MDSRMESQANREVGSSLSKPTATDARSSSMANPEGKVAAQKKEDDLGSQLESKCLKSFDKHHW